VQWTSAERSALSVMSLYLVLKILEYLASLRTSGPMVLFLFSMGRTLARWLLVVLLFVFAFGTAFHILLIEIQDFHTLSGACYSTLRA
jgi:hypothetical protein